MQCDWKAHQKLYGASQAYDSVTLLGIWSGVTMTRAHAYKLNMQDSPECICGLGIEDVPHVLWSCPLRQRGRPLDLMWWGPTSPLLVQNA